jgi:hypothetical protein
MSFVTDENEVADATGASELDTPSAGNLGFALDFFQRTC